MLASWMMTICFSVSRLIRSNGINIFTESIFLNFFPFIFFSRLFHNQVDVQRSFIFLHLLYLFFFTNHSKKNKNNIDWNIFSFVGVFFFFFENRLVYLHSACVWENLSSLCISLPIAVSLQHQQQFLFIELISKSITCTRMSRIYRRFRCCFSSFFGRNS